MKTARFRIPILLLALVLVPLSALAEGVEMVVAFDGAIHKLRQGLYSELFPDGYEAQPGNSVLALDIVKHGHTERVLVPGTEDFYAETPAALHYERRSNTTYLLWQGLVNGLHPLLHLAAFDGGTWSEPIDITGNVFADKASAELVILSEPEVNKESRLLASSVDRSVIYVAWQEIGSNATQKYLVPIVLQDGAYLGWHQSFRLADFVSEQDDTGNQRSRPPVGDEAENLLRIQPSAKANSVVVGFTKPESDRLITLEIEMLPQALSALATRMGDLILQDAETSNSVQELAVKARANITQYGSDFHQSTLEYLADQIEALLLEHSTVASAVAPGMPEKFGVTIVHIGARVRSKGLIDPEPREIIQLGQSREGGAPYHHLKVTILVDREAPVVGGPAVLFLSSTGVEALVAWEEEGRIVFRESEGAEWSEPQIVEFSAELDKEDVYRILANRTLNR